MMRSFPTREALVAVYWRKLASSVSVSRNSRSRVSARRAVRMASHSPARRYKRAATELLRPRAQFDSNL